jgi:two-component system response regulator CpxR
MKPKRTILCVDDNEQALSIRKVLLETRGYRVLTCTTGEEALDKFRKGGIDLVLTDLFMPGLLPKGMHVPAELLERIRLLLVRKRGPKRLQARPMTAA